MQVFQLNIISLTNGNHFGFHFSINIYILPKIKKIIMKLNAKIISILYVFSLIIQLIIISYNHLTGFHIQNSILSLVFSIIYSTFFSGITAICLFFFNLKLIDFCDKFFSWQQKAAFRIIVESLGLIINSAILSSILTITVHSINSYKNGLEPNLINNFLITTVINMIMVIALEAYIFYSNWKKTKQKADELERQNMIAQLESLKNQLNPHFLFNSLNVLMSLIRKDASAAEKFLEEFSKIYRYITESSELHLIELIKEIDFSISYLKLNKYRFGDGIRYMIDGDLRSIDALIPPVSIQLAIENAIKHNSTDIDSPLIISIYHDNNQIVVKNSFQPRYNENDSTGIGIKNLVRRYNLLSDKKAEFYSIDNYYYSKLPLIREEDL